MLARRAIVVGAIVATSSGCNALASLGDPTFRDAIDAATPDDAIEDALDETADGTPGDSLDDTTTADEGLGGDADDAPEDIADAGDGGDACTCAGKVCGAGNGCGVKCKAGSGCCTPTCGGICGYPNGCGGSCGFGSGCASRSRFFIGYGDPAFGGLCADGTARDSTECLIAAHRFCRSAGWASGFPVQTNATQIEVLCVASASTIDLTAAQVASLDPGCTPANNWFLIACAHAANAYCRATSFVAGFGPIAAAADHITVACIPAPFARLVVSQPLPSCPPPYRGEACDAAGDTQCVRAGTFGGTPVSESAGTFDLLCVK